MFKLLIGIIFFFVFLLLLVGTIGIAFLRSLFGGNKKPTQQSNETNRTYTNPDKDKIFNDHEGEYVEYEEIKDTPKRDEGNMEEKK